MRTLNAFLTTAALVLGGIAACATEEDGDIAELEEGSDDSKTDQPDFELTPLDLEPADPFVEKVGVIKSKTAFKSVFGFAAPSSIRFDRDWVIYYTAGAQTSGGYHASIDRVRLSDSGKTLRITAHLDKPGFDCLNTQAITTPYAVVKIAKPSSAPTTNRYYRVETVTNCGSSCAGTTETETIYERIGDTREACTVAAEHCVTNDSWACPQLQPLPPTFCSGGTVKTGRRHYIASADGMECSMPSVHCVTNNSSACPQLSPLPPNYCPAGTRLETEPNFIASADGMECLIPHVYCVDVAAPACPTL